MYVRMTLPEAPMTESLHILCPIDFSPTSERALDYGLALAKRLSGRVTVVHAYALPSVLLPEGAVLPDAEAQAQASNEHQARLNKIVEQRKGWGTPIAQKLRMGTPATEILSAIQQERPDLVVMGTHGRSGIEHVLIGSVAERVVRASTVPVMTIREPHVGDKHAQQLTVDIKKVVCPVDFSEPSAKAVQHAVGLCKRLGAELQLVHVCSSVAYAIADESFTVKPDLMRELKAHVQSELDKLASATAQSGVKVTTQVREGVPHKAIHEAAHAAKADVIVIGTHGRTGFEHLLLGSVAERVVRTSTLPVITVHPQL
jgi:nucleotide-binding universal stress UspA family protein